MFLKFEKTIRQIAELGSEHSHNKMAKKKESTRLKVNFN